VSIEFREIWAVDFEFRPRSDNRPAPVVCMVAMELISGKIIRLWEEELYTRNSPPFPTSKDTLILAYNLMAEMSCFLVLGWELPARCIDLFVEFRNITNGLILPHGMNLPGALMYFGVDGLSSMEKKGMIQKILENNTYSSKLKKEILDYCQSDVEALGKLYPHIIRHKKYNSKYALLRGRYIKNLSRVERLGLPVDQESLVYITQNWGNIKSDFIRIANKPFDVYEDTRFRTDKFKEYLQRQNIKDWPTTVKGSIELKDETFKKMSAKYPQLLVLRDLRKSLSQLRMHKIKLGPDGRMRCRPKPFMAITGRNQPSTTENIYSLPKWARSLIKPHEKMGLAQLDWVSQEFGVAAALSGDKAMQDTYNSGDVYIEFAKLAGAVPKDATKESHPRERQIFKAVMLGVQYQMTHHGLSKTLGISLAEAKHLINLHQQIFKKFWAWSELGDSYAWMYGELFTRFGWYLNVHNGTKPKTVRNFPMQANGNEMLRLATIYAVEAGIKVCATIHDALVIEAPLDSLDRAVIQTRKCMDRASEIILDGFILRIDVKRTIFPERQHDERGKVMWETIQKLLTEKNFKG
jgi:hypothetical protein